MISLLELLKDDPERYVQRSVANNLKLRKLVLEAGDRATLADSISFRRMTTRRHCPGLHRIEALVNGIAYPVGEFAVRSR